MKIEVVDENSAVELIDDHYKKIDKSIYEQNSYNLDNLTREVMYLRITGELSFKEIGDILNKTENWARVTFYRGKKKIKEVSNDE